LQAWATQHESTTSASLYDRARATSGVVATIAEVYFDGDVVVRVEDIFFTGWTSVRSRPGTPIRGT